MPLATLLSQVDVGVAVLIAIPLGLAALALLAVAVVAAALAGCAAAGWALRRADEAVLGGAGKL